MTSEMRKTEKIYLKIENVLRHRFHYNDILPSEFTKDPQEGNRVQSDEYHFCN